MRRVDNTQSKSSLRLACAVLSLLLLHQTCEAVVRTQSFATLSLRTSVKDNPTSFLLNLRGGSSPSSSKSSSTSKKNKKKSGKTTSSKTKSSSSSSTGTKSKKKKKKAVQDKNAAGDNSDDHVSQGKKVLGEALEKDAAEALGDAIRLVFQMLRKLILFSSLAFSFSLLD
jgi:hypothetical protein